MVSPNSRKIGVLSLGPLVSIAALVSVAMNCGGGDSAPPPPAPAQPGYAPTQVPLGNFNMSCGNPQSSSQQQVQVQTKFQPQQQSNGGRCAPQFQFRETKISDWDVDLDCDQEVVFVQSRGYDPKTATLTVQNDGTVKGSMSFEQLIQNDGVSNTVCWVQYQVLFDGRASCGRDSSTGQKRINMNTQVQFAKSDPTQIPQNSDLYSLTETATPDPTLPEPSISPSPSMSPSPSPSPSPEITSAPTFVPIPVPTPSASPFTPPSPTSSPSPRPTRTPTPRPPAPVPVVPIEICVIQNPCPFSSSVDYSCPNTGTSQPASGGGY